MAIWLEFKPFAWCLCFGLIWNLEFLGHFGLVHKKETWFRRSCNGTVIFTILKLLLEQCVDRPNLLWGECCHVWSHFEAPIEGVWAQLLRKIYLPDFTSTSPPPCPYLPTSPAYLPTSPAYLSTSPDLPPHLSGLPPHLPGQPRHLAILTHTLQTRESSITSTNMLCL